MKRPMLVATAFFLFGLATNCAPVPKTAPGPAHQGDLLAPGAQAALVDLPAAAEAPLPFLHPLFSDHTVLQRDSAVPVWGWTTPGAQVAVQIHGASYHATAAADGRWQVKVGPFPAGGPFELTVQGPSSVTLNDILFGDVWLCSGQSNMQFSTDQALNAHEELNNSNVPGLRLFQVPQVYSKQPQRLPGGSPSWTVTTPDSVGPFSAACFFYGRELRQHLHIPIGLIHSSWGGTPAEAWTSPEQLATIADFAPILAALPQQTIDQNSATVLYNGMIAPLLPFAIKGAAWYQGEGNAYHAAQYRRLLPTMIKDWRQRFDVGTFPFMVVQLANYTGQQSIPAEDSSWAELRESQLATVQEDAHAGIALAIDIGEAWDIHPKNKQDVGLRLAAAAFSTAYGETKTATSPIFAAVKAAGNRLRVRFTGAESGLMVGKKIGLAPVVEVPEAALLGFAVAGSDGVFAWADAAIDAASNEVVVSSPLVPNPVAVRYDWATNPIGNLYNRAGLPASPFRSDPRFGVGVVGGSGAGSYVPGAVVTISADAPTFGRAFAQWEGDTELLADRTSASTTLVMPKAYVSVRAVYR